MNDDDAAERWIQEDGPEPEGLRPLLDALRAPSSATPRGTESMDRRLFEKVGAELARMALEDADEGSPVEAAGAPAVRRVAHGGPTLRCAVAELVASAPPAAPDTAPPSLVPPSLVTRLPPSLPQVVRPPAGLVETARSMEWAASRRERVFQRSPGRAVVAPFAPMTVVQYASLRAEPAMWPEWARAILGKYHVMNEAALDEHWQARWREKPEEQAAFERAFVEYTAWLRAYAASAGQPGSEFR